MCVCGGDCVSYISGEQEPDMSDVLYRPRDTVSPPGALEYESDGVCAYWRMKTGGIRCTEDFVEKRGSWEPK